MFLNRDSVTVTVTVTVVSSYFMWGRSNSFNGKADSSFSSLVLSEATRVRVTAYLLQGSPITENKPQRIECIERA
jgi:hypothetical protein